MKRVAASLLLALGLIAGAPLLGAALAQQPVEQADEPLGDGFADDGEFDDSDWGSEWGEDPFGEAADEEWNRGSAGSEHGEGHEAHFDLPEFVASVANFALWLALILYLAWKPGAEFLRNRRRAVEEGLVEAKNLKDAAEEKYADYSERLERLDEKLEELREEMVRAGEKERDQILADAEARATRMRRDAQFIIEQQMKQMRQDLTQEAISTAVDAAERVLDKQVKDADQTRLANEYLDQLEASMREDAA